MYCEGEARLLFAENETNNERNFGTPDASRYVKDGINNYVLSAFLPTSVSTAPCCPDVNETLTYRNIAAAAVVVALLTTAGCARTASPKT